jgi:hypothetical protein
MIVVGTRGISKYPVDVLGDVTEAVAEPAQVFRTCA